jgi:predicted O-methyltransferase YrrM
MSSQAIREFINKYNAASAGLAALGAALDARATGTLLEPVVAARVQQLLAALGGDDLLKDVSAEDAAPFLAELRYTLPIEAKLLHAETRAPGWTHTEPQVLQAIGDFARMHASGLTRNVIPALEGLAERFAATGTTFLDMGVGVAGTAIGMAQMWPQLRIVGIDPWQPALALARENVKKAGLTDRIELREQGGENLADDKAFDLAWIPMAFMPERIVPAAVERTLHALRPGGWVVFNCWADFAGTDPKHAALWQLRGTIFGGPPWNSVEGEKLLRDKGYVDVRTLPSPPNVPIGVVVGRRKP